MEKSLYASDSPLHCARSRRMLDLPLLHVRGNMRMRPGSVFVPYEQFNSVVRRVYDLPRFVEPEHVMAFIHKQTLGKRRIDWREEFDAISINEYMRCIGEEDELIPKLLRFTPLNS